MKLIMMVWYSACCIDPVTIKKEGETNEVLHYICEMKYK